MEPHRERSGPSRRSDPAGALGRAAGLALAPVVGAIAAARRSRMFHPAGLVYRAEVRPAGGGDADAAARAGHRLAGPALVRLSSAWWKEREWRDVLGVAVRFRASTTPSERPEPGDQDLLFATIRWPWTTPLAPLTTRHHDFLANDYHAVSPFRDVDLGRIKWRLRPAEPSPAGGTRADRLAAAVASSAARLDLAALPAGVLGPALPVASIDLLEPLDLDQEALRFSPFRCGRGVEPVGFVHGLRRAAYAASRAAGHR